MSDPREGRVKFQRTVFWKKETSGPGQVRVGIAPRSVCVIVTVKRTWFFALAAQQAYEYVLYLGK